MKVLTETGFALRRLSKSPGFALAVVLTLALALGINIAIFSLVNSVLVQPLPYPESQRLVALRHAAPKAEIDETIQSDGTYLHYRRNSRLLQAIALYQTANVNLSGMSAPEQVRTLMTTPSLLSMLGAKPLHGRLFNEQDGVPGSPTVALLSHELWSRRYGADPEIVGRTIEMNLKQVEVVGVFPAGFHFPDPQTRLWLNLRVDPAEAQLAAFWGFYRRGIGLLKPGATIEQCRKDLQQLIPKLAEAYNDANAELLDEIDLRAKVVPMKDAVVGDTGPALWILLGSSAFVLIVACTNIASIFLVRLEEQSREASVRRALGAGRRDLLRYSLSESLPLAILGGLLGLFIALGGVRFLVSADPEGLPRLHEVGIGMHELAFAAGSSLLVGLLLGALSYLRHLRSDAYWSLAGGVRTVTAGARGGSMRNALVAVQVAVALTLLIGSALMVRTYMRLQRVEPGFQAVDVLTVQIGLPFQNYETHALSARFFHQLGQDLSSLPGVLSAGAVDRLPLDAFVYEDILEPLEWEDDRRGAVALQERIPFRMTTPGYFRTMKIPLVKGQLPAWDGPRGVLINSALEKRLFAGENPLGRRVRRGGREPWLTILGVVGDVRSESLTEDPQMMLYLPVFEQELDPRFANPGVMSMAIRSEIPPSALMASIRRTVRDLDSKVPLSSVRTMEQVVSVSTARTSLTMLLLIVSASTALLLGALGVYAMISYAVSRRTQEIGVRIALGARTRDVSLLVLQKGAVPVAVGLIAGLLAATALMRFLESLLFEVQPLDPWAFGSMPIFLLTVSLLAAYLPARRASSLEATSALRGG